MQIDRSLKNSAPQKHGEMMVEASNSKLKSWGLDSGIIGILVCLKGASFFKEIKTPFINIKIAWDVKPLLVGFTSVF